MRIADLQDRSSVDEIVVEIIQKDEPRDVNSRSGQPLAVCDATVRDDDGGEIKLTLWNDEVDQVEEGDRIRITKGWVSSYRGELQLSTGKFGALEKL